MVGELLSNVYTTVIPPSLRGLGSEEPTVTERPVCEVTCSDFDERASRVALGFASGGFSVWRFSSTVPKCIELLTETEAAPLRLIKFIPPVKPDPFSMTGSKPKSPGASAAADELALLAWGEPLPAASSNGSSVSGVKSPSETNLDADLAFVDSKQDHVLKLVHVATGKILEELAQPSVIDNIQVSPRMLATMLKNHSALIYLREPNASFSAGRCIMVPHAHPLVIGMRWMTYGAKASLEAKLDTDSPGTSQTTSPTASPLLQQSVWQDLTKSLAVSAFRLGEASSKKLSEYLSSSQTTSASTTEETENVCCANDVIVVRDVFMDQRLVCKIADSTSFLAFDDSGSILVSASTEGQTLNVFSLPRGSLLYKLERGLRPARILNVCFSADRHWVAVTSNRGTTHLFPIHPSGTKATVATHRSSLKDGMFPEPGGGMGRFVATVLGSPSPSHSKQLNRPPPTLSSTPTAEPPKYMMDVQGSNILSISSLAKISLPSNLAPVRTVRFCDSTTVRVLCQNGIVEDFALVVGAVATSDKDEPERLAADIKLFRAFDITRPTGETVLPAAPSDLISVPQTPPPKVKHASDEPSFDFSISNFEAQAYAEPLVPVWASPQFVLVQTLPETDSKNELESIYYTPAGTTIQVRTAAPPPGLADAIRTPAFEDAL